MVVKSKENSRAYESFERELGRAVMEGDFSAEKFEEIDTGLMWRWVQTGWKAANAISEGGS